MIRRIAAVLVALLMAIVVVRNAAVAGFAETRPATAAAMWGSHPRTEISTAMTEIARAAHDRHPVPSLAFSQMTDAAVKEPLAPEPFLVRGVQAELGGDGAGAQRAFEAAQWRDPRSLPAAYFLADRYVRIGDVGHGLREIAALARLSPSGIVTVAPYLAAYARSSSNWAALRQVFRSNPELAEPTLKVLAGDISTAPAVLVLADRGEKAQGAQWLAPLLETLTGAGQYARAQAVWARATGARTGGLIYDSAFTDKTSPPPFNWSLISSAVGLAERQPGGRLHIVFYGQQDGILASELLLLQPGGYRLSMQLLGDRTRARTLNWSIWCDKAAAPIASVNLDAAAAQGWRFTIPAACPAQWLKLSGSSSDISQQVDVTIGALKLEKAGPNA